MSTATDMLAQYLAAETAILQGEWYRLGDQYVKKADLSMVQKGRALWESRVQAEKRAALGQHGPATMRWDT